VEREERKRGRKGQETREIFITKTNAHVAFHGREAAGKLAEMIGKII